MPEPHPDTEDKKTFINRCVPMLIDEGREPKQAVAICNSMWDTATKKKKEDNMTKDDNDFASILPTTRSGNSGVVAGQYPDNELDPNTLPPELRARHHRTREQEINELFPIDGSE